MKKIRPAVLIAAALIILGAAVFFFLKRGSEGSDRAVYVMPVSGQSEFLSDRYAGIVEAQASVDYKKDAEKSVLEIYVTEGQSVANGDALFKYDTEKTENDLAAARLELEGFDNEISALNEEINELSAQRNDASDDEKLDYTTEIQSKQMQVRQKQYEKKIKENEINKLQHEIDYSVVRSTISGVVKRINADGNDPDKPFMSVTQTGKFRIKGTLNEQAMMKITAGQEVIVRSRVNNEEIWKGVISQIEAEPESSNNADYSSGEKSSLYPFYVSLESSEGLMLGQHVYIEPDFGQTAQADGIWLDAGYIVTEENGNTYVWAADSHDRLKKKKVTVGTFDENTLMYQITEGLNQDDRIAWPDDTLKEGMPVTTEAVTEEEPA